MDTSSVKKNLSDIAKFLEEAGFVDAAKNVNLAMDALDGAFAADSIVTNTPDVQNALPGSLPVEMTGEVAGGMQGAFSIPEAQKVAELANRLDQLGLYKEADELDQVLRDMVDDEMPEIIEGLEKERKKDKVNKVEPEEKDKAGVGTLVDANGHVGTGVTDNQNAGMFQGFSDSYFYRGYGNLEGAYGPQ